MSVRSDQTLAAVQALHNSRGIEAVIDHLQARYADTLEQMVDADEDRQRAELAAQARLLRELATEFGPSPEPEGSKQYSGGYAG